MYAPDFEKIFNALGGCYLILSSNSPEFTIVAVSDAYLEATYTSRQLIIGKGLFEVFPDNPADANADGVSNLRASLLRVLDKKEIDFMQIQKYDIKQLDTEAKAFEVRYWLPDNAPVVDDSGEVEYIIHHVTDVTAQELLIKQYGGAESNMDDMEQSAIALTQVERLNRLMVSRELKMVELKKEIAELREDTEKGS